MCQNTCLGQVNVQTVNNIFFFSFLALLQVALKKNNASSGVYQFWLGCLWVCMSIALSSIKLVNFLPFLGWCWKLIFSHLVYSSNSIVVHRQYKYLMCFFLLICPVFLKFLWKLEKETLNWVCFMEYKFNWMRKNLLFNIFFFPWEYYTIWLGWKID